MAQELTGIKECGNIIESKEVFFVIASLESFILGIMALACCKFLLERQDFLIKAGLMRDYDKPAEMLAADNINNSSHPASTATTPRNRSLAAMPSGFNASIASGGISLDTPFNPQGEAQGDGVAVGTVMGEVERRGDEISPQHHQPPPPPELSSPKTPSHTKSGGKYGGTGKRGRPRGATAGGGRSGRNLPTANIQSMYGGTAGGAPSSIGGTTSSSSSKPNNNQHIRGPSSLRTTDESPYRSGEGEGAAVVMSGSGPASLRESGGGLHHHQQQDQDFMYRDGFQTMDNSSFSSHAELMGTSTGDNMYRFQFQIQDYITRFYVFLIAYCTASSSTLMEQMNGRTQTYCIKSQALLRTGNLLIEVLTATLLYLNIGSLLLIIHQMGDEVTLRTKQAMNRRDIVFWAILIVSLFLFSFLCVLGPAGTLPRKIGDLIDIFVALALATFSAFLGYTIPVQVAPHAGKKAAGYLRIVTIIICICFIVRAVYDFPSEVAELRIDGFLINRGDDNREADALIYQVMINMIPVILCMFVLRFMRKEVQAAQQQGHSSTNDDAWED